VTHQSDIASVAGQLADLTRSVEHMADQLKSLGERADTQQERIDLAAKELVEVSSRLQAAAHALRESI
jgi:DNA anti-recombination protein RmuC